MGASGAGGSAAAVSAAGGPGTGSGADGQVTRDAEPAAAGQGAEPAADGSAQHAVAAGSGYVPAPVAFVSEGDEDQDEDAAGGARDDAGAGPGASGWKDSGRYGSGEKTFDVNASRRRPVVFEEDDDLDVPDFLK